MKKTLTVSIVIPSYNEAEHLKACLESIALQTVMPDEVIVVDNNSSDNSVEIAQTFPFVTLIHEKDQGVTPARNAGFNAVKSDIIGRIDADSRLLPDWVETVKTIFESEPELSAATGPVAYYDMPLVKFGLKADNLARKLVSLAQTTPFLFGSNMAMRTKDWHDVASQTCNLNNIHEDLDLAIHLNQSGHQIAYKQHMMALASSRRLEEDPKSYYNYLKMNLNTYKSHGIETVTPRVATSLGWLAYITMKPVRVSYDQETGKLSVRRIFEKRNKRGNPNG